MTLPFGRVAFPELYERELVGPLFRPFAEAMIAELAPAAGGRFLDVSCHQGAQFFPTARRRFARCAGPSRTTAAWQWVPGARRRNSRS